MKIKTKLTFKEYLRMLYELFYRKAMIIALIVIAVVILNAIIVTSLGASEKDAGSPFLPIIFLAAIVAFVPYSIYASAKKMYYSNSYLQNEIEYELTPEQLKIIGTGFYAEKDWGKTHKIVEVKSFFVIFESKGSVNAIPKNNLSVEETIALKAFFLGLGSVKNKRFYNK